MLQDRTLSSQKRNSNPLFSNSTVRFNPSYCLGVTLATAGICCLNSNRVSAATKSIDSHQDNNHSFHDSQHHRASGFLPRILSLFRLPFWSERAVLSPDSRQVEQTQNTSTFIGMGGSLHQDFTPLYLSQAQSSSTKEFGNVRLGSIKPSISYSRILAAQSQPKLQTYIVEAGDTINHIAQKHQVSRDEIIKLNNINNSNIIFVSQQLKIPVTKSEDSTSKMAMVQTNLPSDRVDDAQLNSTTKNWDNLLGLNSENSDDMTTQHIVKLRLESKIRKSNYQQPSNQDNLISKSSQNLDSQITETISLQLPPLPPSEEYLPNAFDGYAWPAQGVLTSGYGWRWGRLHKGIDIAGPVGTPVFAAASGEVIEAGWNSGGYGNLIKLKHLDGSVTIYAHNHKILVNSGQKVNQGDQIAEMGNTGFSTGSHLHFEIHSKERGIVNPLALLR